MEKARQQGIAQHEFPIALRSFCDGLKNEIRRMQMLLDDPAGTIRVLFADRTSENEGIRRRWEGVLDRLGRTDPGYLEEIIYNDDHLQKYLVE
jgi:hypothetical protein